MKHAHLGRKAEIEAVANEAAGHLVVTRVGVHQLLELQRDAAAGDADAARLVPAVLAAVRYVNEAPEECKVHCGICWRSVRPFAWYRIGVIHGDVPEPELGLSFLACPSCSMTLDAFERAVSRLMGRHWPYASYRHEARSMTQSRRISNGGGWGGA